MGSKVGMPRTSSSARSGCTVFELPPDSPRTTNDPRETRTGRDRGPIHGRLYQVAAFTGDSCLDTITPKMRSIAITWLQVCQPWKK